MMGPQVTMFDPNLVYAAGSHVFNQYAQDLTHQSKSWVERKLKYYFAVDTPYVLKKLALLFFPFSHKVGQLCVCVDAASE